MSCLQSFVMSFRTSCWQFDTEDCGGSDSYIALEEIRTHNSVMSHGHPKIHGKRSAKTCSSTIQKERQLQTRHGSESRSKQTNIDTYSVDSSSKPSFFRVRVRFRECNLLQSKCRACTQCDLFVLLVFTKHESN